MTCPRLPSQEAAEVGLEWGSLDLTGAVADISMGQGRRREEGGSTSS